MEKEIRINEYIDRIREEIRYKDYAHAKELCFRASNVDSQNLCVKYLRDFIEIHKKENGRYDVLSLKELNQYLLKCMSYITAENWESLSIYISCLTDEIEKCKPNTLDEFNSLYIYSRNLGAYSKKLLAVIQEIQTYSTSLILLKKAVEDLKKRLDKTETEIKARKELEEKIRRRDRLIKRWILIITLGIISIGLLLSK